MKTILILEDDENLSRGIAFTFERDGYHTIIAGSVKEGKGNKGLSRITDLILLDLGLPDGNGLDLYKEIRTYSKVPIIMLTACDLETENRHIIHSGIFKLDTNLCKLYKENKEIPVNATEYKLLSFMMTNAGQVLSKEQILSSLWDSKGNYVDENTLPVNISRLRTKLEEDSKNPQIIKTIHGIGYIWNEGMQE